MEGKKHMPVRLVAKKNKTVDLIRLPSYQPKSSELVSHFTTSSSSIDSVGCYRERKSDLGPLALPRLQSTKGLQKSLERLSLQPLRMAIDDEKILKAVDDRCVNKELNFPPKERLFKNLPPIGVDADDIVRKAEEKMRKKAKVLRPPHIKKDPEPKLSEYAKPYVVKEPSVVRLPIPDTATILRDITKAQIPSQAKPGGTLVDIKELYQDVTRNYKLSLFD